MTISADTQVTDLSADDHACLTFGEREELLDLTAAFVRDGLDGGLRVVVLSNTPQLAAERLGRRGVDSEPTLAAGQMVVASCHDSLDPVTLASVTPLHSHSVAAATYYSDQVLRICRQYVPPGIRLAGELDFLASETLALALSEAIRIGGDITINMTDLRFIDGSSIRMIMEAVGGLEPVRTVILQCRPTVEARFVRFGVTDLPRVRLVGVDEA